LGLDQPLHVMLTVRKLARRCEFEECEPCFTLLLRGWVVDPAELYAIVHVRATAPLPKPPVHRCQSYKVFWPSVLPVGRWGDCGNKREIGFGVKTWFSSLRPVVLGLTRRLLAYHALAQSRNVTRPTAETYPATSREAAQYATSVIDRQEPPSEDKVQPFTRLRY
jgi:hypothetical protein